jgi:hypothetical protein
MSLPIPLTRWGATERTLPGVGLPSPLDMGITVGQKGRGWVFELSWTVHWPLCGQWELFSLTVVEWPSQLLSRQEGSRRTRGGPRRTRGGPHD